MFISIKYLHLFGFFMVVSYVDAHNARFLTRRSDLPALLREQMFEDYESLFRIQAGFRRQSKMAYTLIISLSDL